MSIIYRNGDIFTSTAQTLVNPVNCVGVMGKGLALAFKQRFPAIYEPYRKRCEQKLLRPHMVQLLRSASHQWVLNFPTKDHWRDPSRLSYVECGLLAFADLYEVRGITSIAFPVLGCGEGRLEWRDVQPVMERILGPLSLPCEIWLLSK